MRMTVLRLSAWLSLSVLLLTRTAAAQPSAGLPIAVADSIGVKTRIRFADARPVLVALRGTLPPALQVTADAELEPAWERWVAAHDAAVRQRLDRGDEDSIVNFWLFGTRFTKLPPARAQDLANLGPLTAPQLLARRLDDLITSVTRGDTNERVAFVRQYIKRTGIDPSTATGRDRVRQLLITARARMLAEYAITDRQLAAARQSTDARAEIAAESVIFRNRGLSSDTSIFVNFAVERALEGLKSSSLLRAGSVRRVAVVGPGLDFINKTDGHDFYPQQTIQPFAVIDSLKRLGLVDGDLRVVTLDISPRVNHHLSLARQRARSGQPYLIHVPLPLSESWTADVRSFWSRFGDQIGTPWRRTPVSGGAAVRVVRVRAATVGIVIPEDVNIVIDRLELRADDLFDVIVATNILVYYDVFEQALAAGNIGKMLRRGGVLLSNNDILPFPPLQTSVGFLNVTYSDRHYDNMFAYQRD